MHLFSYYCLQDSCFTNVFG